MSTKKSKAVKSGNNYNHHTITHQPFGGKGKEGPYNPDAHRGTLGDHKAGK